MADKPPQTITRQLANIGRLSAHGQFGMVLGLAVVVALAIGAVIWAMQPNYRILLSPGSDRDLGEVSSALERYGVPYRLHERTGALMVPARNLAEVRMRLASDGLPKAGGLGFEFLEQDTALGTSRLQESARYKSFMEGEIASSIATLNNVAEARVHLALPSSTAFIGDRAKPSASVVIRFRAGHSPDNDQIAGITHMVASSVPELESERVTVLDQRGRLLSQGGDDDVTALSARQLDYKNRMEKAYEQSVREILAPVIGEDGIRVKVNADIDFTQTESTVETYDPEAPALISESVSSNESTGAPSGGVPGALTNQPPADGTIAVDDGVTGEVTPVPTTRNSSSTRNFEVDRTIDYVRQAAGTVSRLSVAVVVDDRVQVGDDGERVRTGRDESEMQRLTSLVREAVGFDADRGDTLQVTNFSFRELEELPPAEPVPFWQLPWIWDLARYLAAGVGIFLLVTFVLRPVLKSLAALPAPRPQPLVLEGAGGSPGVEALSMATPEPSHAAAADRALGRARQIAEEDPRLVAQVVKGWINDGN